MGQEIAMAYIKPEYNCTTVKARLQVMEREGANTFMGDLNCHGGNKGRKLAKWIEQEELMDVGTAEYTHRWGKHRCTIDTRGVARPWAIAGVGSRVRLRGGRSQGETDR